MSSEEADMVIMPPRLPRGVSIRTFERVCAAAEVCYRDAGRSLPPIGDVIRTSGVMDRVVAKILNSPEFKEEMLRRGVRWSLNEKFLAKLTPEQIYCLGIITDITNKKPLSEKLKRAGVSYSQYRAWLKQPEFAARMQQMGEQLLGDNLAAVHSRLVQRAESGDVQAIKLFYEVSGRHDPNRQQTVDIMRLIGLVLESITKHVRDPIVLGALSEDLDLILNGGVPEDDGTMPNNYVPSQAMIEGKVLPHHNQDADVAINRANSREEQPVVIKSKAEREVEEFLRKNNIDPRML